MKNKFPKGLSENLIRNISKIKKEPKWMLKKRLEALSIFNAKKIPTWGPDLTSINFSELNYYIPSSSKKNQKWEDVPKKIKDTFEKIGVPEAERKFLAGVGAQYDSEIVYKSLSKMLSQKGVIFQDMETGLKEHEDLVKANFGKLIPSSDNKFSALNTACWSGGTFLYIPKNIKIDLPLQSYFRIASRNMGQFERTLIIAEEGSYVHFTEGCTAPTYSTNSLHAGVVEIMVKKNARVRYTTVQNWSKNIFNLVTKRMFVEENGIGEFVDCNIGSKVTMKYPSIYLKGKYAKGEILSISLASGNQVQDTGGKIFHLAHNTSSKILSKSISKNGGHANYRGFVMIAKNAKKSKSKVKCQGLILDSKSSSASSPFMDVKEKDVEVSHEAFISKIEEEKLFYLCSRGISEEKAEEMMVNGFIEPIVKELPMEYAIELNRLIKLEIFNSVI